jgi:hypothetical protein
MPVMKYAGRGWMSRQRPPRRSSRACVDAALAGLLVRELGLLGGDRDTVGLAAVAQMRHDAAAAASAAGVEDPAR